MQGHGLMQAITRVNRVFRNKPGGLVVDYLGLADQLKKALITYTERLGDLNKHGYPPDLEEEATRTVLQQAELLCADWVG